MARNAPEAVLLIGIPAAGKTTLYVERFFHSHVRISRDMLRTRAREIKLVRACIEARQSFAVDNTNLSREERAPYIAEARAAGFRITGYFFRPSVRRSIALNKKRGAEHNVPVFGILRAFKRIEAPALDEGFDAIYQVDLSEGLRFVVERL